MVGVSEVPKQGVNLENEPVTKKATLSPKHKGIPLPTIFHLKLLHTIMLRVLFGSKKNLPKLFQLFLS